jgi:hypothetical protein
MGIAAQLLEETDLRLTEVAPRVGYRSEFSFSRAFKLARGVSPMQYRRAAQSRSRPSQTGAACTTPQQIPLNQQHAVVYDDDLTGRVPAPHEAEISLGNVGRLTHMVYTAGDSVWQRVLGETQLEDAKGFFDVRFWRAFLVT